jgi:trk system potassium uptake protein TrkH
VNYRLVCKQLGLLMLVLAGSLFVPLAWAFKMRREQPEPMNEPLTALGIAIGVAVVGGWLLFRLGRGQRADLRRKEALLLVATSWFFGAAVAALPFRIWAFLRPADANVDPAFGSWINCYFEAMSGLTTTGSTILTRIATIPESLLLWRCMTQWLGGLGIVVLFVAVLPMLGVGGKRLFRVESAGPTPADMTPRIRSTAQVLWAIYLAFTLAETLLLRWQGLSWFESLCHTFTTLSTGGFSTRDASVGGFENLGVEIVITTFMVLSAINFGLYHQVFQGKWRDAVRDPELRAFLFLLGAATVVVIFTLRGTPVVTTTGRQEAELGPAVRHGVFQSVSIQTETGYGTADFDRWPFGAKTMLLVMMFVGGCAGSTAGGIKVVRCLIVAKVIGLEIERVFRPNVVRAIRVGRATVDADLRLATVVHVVCLFGVFGLGTIGLMVLEPDGSITLTTAATATATTLHNCGPGLDQVGPTRNFVHLGATSKCLLSLIMAMGRLELFPLMVLFTPRFWRAE